MRLIATLALALALAGGTFDPPPGGMMVEAASNYACRRIEVFGQRCFICEHCDGCQSGTTWGDCPPEWQLSSTPSATAPSRIDRKSNPQEQEQ